jgi:hypothetical protein
VIGSLGGKAGGCLPVGGLRAELLGVALGWLLEGVPGAFGAGEVGIGEEGTGGRGGGASASSGTESRSNPR